NSSNPLLLTGYLDIFLKFEVEQILVDVNPDMLAFVKHWLRVHRAFASKFESLSKKGVSFNFESNTTSTSLKHPSSTTNDPSNNSLHGVNDPKVRDKKLKDTSFPEASSAPLDF